MREGGPQLRYPLTWLRCGLFLQGADRPPRVPPPLYSGCLTTLHKPSGSLAWSGPGCKGAAYPWPLGLSLQPGQCRDPDFL